MEKRRFKEETHAARWGLMRGYSVKATKWVDFVMTDSTRRESCHLLKITGISGGVKGAEEKVKIHQQMGLWQVLNEALWPWQVQVLLYLFVSVQERRLAWAIVLLLQAADQ